MATIHPEGWREIPAVGAAARELETLERLGAALPDGYTLYHGVHWSSLEQGRSVYGDVDFALVNRAGDLLLIEQKSGFLEESPDGLALRGATRVPLVATRIADTLSRLRRRLEAALGANAVAVEYLFYCPDYRVRRPATAGIDPARVVDAGGREGLVRRIREILPEGEATGLAPKVHRFLRDVLQLEPDVSALVGRARTLVRRIAGGLAHWARQLEMAPFRLRVTGTAGSGKTQLALAEYRDALDAGRRPLYVCYNRPLADHFEAIAPPGGRVCTFHMLCDQMLRALDRAPDFSLPEPFERMVEAAADANPPESFLCDTLIVDEGQDFPERWRDLVLRHARPGARLLWLEDPMQNLYARDPVALPGWVGLRARANYRSPRAILRLLEPLLPAEGAIEARSPIEGEVDVLVYTGPDSLLARVKEAVRHCFSAGFRRDDVAIVSFRGREQSQLLGLDLLGPNRLRRFTGRYDLFGAPLYTDGDLLVESVYRFKGQSAPAVILAEVDFDVLDERALRKLFVGATRATMKLVVVASERVAGRLAAPG